jgi:hypothetical protein
VVSYHQSERYRNCLAEKSSSWEKSYTRTIEFYYWRPQHISADVLQSRRLEGSADKYRGPSILATFYSMTWMDDIFKNFNMKRKFLKNVIRKHFKLQMYPIKPISVGLPNLVRLSLWKITEVHTFWFPYLFQLVRNFSVACLSECGIPTNLYNGLWNASQYHGQRFGLMLLGEQYIDRKLLGSHARSKGYI